MANFKGPWLAWQVGGAKLSLASRDQESPSWLLLSYFGPVLAAVSTYYVMESSQVFSKR